MSAPNLDQLREKIAVELYRARLTAGIDQYALAALVGCSQYSISRWERGLNLPNAAAFLALIQVLGIELEDFQI